MVSPRLVKALIALVAFVAVFLSLGAFHAGDGSSFSLGLQRRMFADTDKAPPMTFAPDETELKRKEDETDGKEDPGDVVIVEEEDPGIGVPLPNEHANRKGPDRGLHASSNLSTSKSAAQQLPVVSTSPPPKHPPNRAVGDENLNADWGKRAHDLAHQEVKSGAMYECPPNSRRFNPPKKKLIMHNPCACEEFLTCVGQACRTVTTGYLAISLVFPQSCSDCKCVETPLYPPDKGLPADHMGPSIIVIGIGSGRCGTHTLGALLSAQGARTHDGYKAVMVTHERVFQWGCPRYEWPSSDFPFTASTIRDKATKALKTLISRFPFAEVTGDVAHFHLPYIRHFLELDTRVKVVILQRKKEDTIASWVRWWAKDEQRISYRFPFLDKEDREAARLAGMQIGYDSYWDNCFPRYKFETATPALEEGIERHYDSYYAEVDKLMQEYAGSGRVKKYDTYELLGDESGSVMEELFGWIGIKPPYHKVVIQHSKTQ